MTKQPTKREKRGAYRYRKPENEKKPVVKKKKNYTKAEWAKLSPSKRWELMTWEEISRELVRLRISYGQAQVLKQQGKLPFDFGEKRGI